MPAVRLMAFAVATYPRVFRQITRMTTGLSPSDPRFVDAWSRFLETVGERIAERSESTAERESDLPKSPTL